MLFFTKLPKISHTHKKCSFISINGKTNCFYPVNLVNFMPLSCKEPTFFVFANCEPLSASMSRCHIKMSNIEHAFFVETVNKLHGGCLTDMYCHIIFQALTVIWLDVSKAWNTHYPLAA